MLTEAEKKWLEDREQVEIANGLYSCAHCQLFSNTYSVYTGYCIGEYAECPIVPNYRDAAEFEARVAAKLVSNNFPCRTCPDFRIATKCPITTRGTDTDYGPFPCLLRQARLAVEQEME